MEDTKRGHSRELADTESGQMGGRWKIAAAPKVETEHRGVRNGAIAGSETDAAQQGVDEDKSGYIQPRSSSFPG